MRTQRDQVRPALLRQLRDRLDGSPIQHVGGDVEARIDEAPNQRGKLSLDVLATRVRLVVSRKALVTHRLQIGRRRVGEDEFDPRKMLE